MAVWTYDEAGATYDDSRLTYDGGSVVPVVVTGGAIGGGVAIDWSRLKPKKKSPLPAVFGRSPIVTITPSLDCTVGALALSGAAPVTMTGAVVVCSPGVARWWSSWRQERRLRRHAEELWLLTGVD